jgi:hypothetical protein
MVDIQVVCILFHLKSSADGEWVWRIDDSKQNDDTYAYRPVRGPLKSLGLTYDFRFFHYNTNEADEMVSDSTGGAPRKRTTCKYEFAMMWVCSSPTVTSLLKTDIHQDFLAF